MSKVNNDADLLLRVRRDKISRVNNDAELQSVNNTRRV